MSSIDRLLFAPADPDELPFARTLIFAPHPDDESIGAGGLLAHVARRGATVRVVYLTSGENNPWPQRAARRRWTVTAEDCREWGRRRRAEARCALINLGIPPQNATFLGYPDDGLARTNRLTLVARVAGLLDDFRPTLLVIPSIHDLHPDHRAAYRAIAKAVSTANIKPELILSYVVHGRDRSRVQKHVPITGEERSRKRQAIERHATQLLLSRRRLMRYAQRDEEFGVVEDFSFREETWIAATIAKIRHLLTLL